MHVGCADGQGLYGLLRLQAADGTGNCSISNACSYSGLVTGGLYSPHSTHSSCAAVCSITHFTAAKHACHGGASGGGTGYICSSNPHSMPSAALFRLTRVDQRGYGLDDVRLGGVSLRMPLQDDHVRLLDVLTMPQCVATFSLLCM